MMSRPGRAGEARTDSARRSFVGEGRSLPPQRQEHRGDRLDHAPAPREPALGRDPGDDRTGHVLAQEAWERLALPAARRSGRMPCPRAFLGVPADRPAPRRGAATGTRRGGGARADPPHPRRIPPGHFVPGVAGQYQQAPAPLGGGLVKPAWFARYRAAELPARFERIVQSWDTANKATELADFSVCTSWGIRAKHLYLIERRARALRLPGTEAPGEGRASPLAGRCRPDRGQGLGHPADPGTARRGDARRHRYRPQADKIMRIYAQSAVPGLDPGIENGFVHLPETAPWLALYLYELSCFPYGRHDDQVPPDTLFRGRPPRCSTGSKRPGAKTASSPITACSPKSAAARHAAERPPTGGAATPWSEIWPLAPSPWLQPPRSQAEGLAPSPVWSATAPAGSRHAQVSLALGAES